MTTLPLSLFIYFIPTCSAFFLRKKSFIFVNPLPENSWGRRCRRKSERRGKRKWSQRRKKKALWGLEKEGIDGRRAAKVRQRQLSPTWEINLTFHPELPSFLFCTPSHIVAVLSWLCKVCLLKRRHCTPEETKTKKRGGCHEWVKDRKWFAK